MTRALVTLVFPADLDLRPLSGKRIPLQLTTEHPLCREGLPLLLDPDGEVMTAEDFRHLRARLGASIETDDYAAVCVALAVGLDEAGVVLVGRAEHSGTSIAP